jgi:hypothetical protein
MLVVGKGGLPPLGSVVQKALYTASPPSQISDSLVPCKASGREGWFTPASL